MMTIEERRHAAIVEVSLRRLCEAVESLVARIADRGAESMMRSASHTSMVA